jgi:sugar lactone lactonase YvrE
MKRLVILVSIAVAVGLVAVPAAAGPSFPSSVPLPDGFYPEGIAIGSGHDFYVGSLLDGAVYKGDLRTGDGDVLAPGAAGRLMVGLSFDDRSGLLWGVGLDDGSGAAMAIDGTSGDFVASVEVPGAFLNDIVVTRDAAYITDSLADVFWTIPLDNRGRPAGAARAIPLTGDFTFVTTGDLPINLNGITATPSGTSLLAVHSTLGLLYRINPITGEATEIDLGGDLVSSGDGIVLRGKTLYVVQNFLNQVAVVSLDPGFRSGEITEVITSDLFRVPATAARFGRSLYLVNARFDVALPPFLGGEVMSIDYDVVRVSP